MTPKHYVYCVFEVSSGVPLYIGKGSGLRYLSHLKSSSNSYLRNKVNKFREEGKSVRSEIICYFDKEEDAYKMEIDLISIYKRKKDGGQLCNFCKGGEGFSGPHKEETKKAISEKLSRMHRNGEIDLGSWFRGKHTPISRPVYYSGFIFPSARFASSVLGGSVSMVSAAIYRGCGYYIGDTAGYERYMLNKRDKEILRSTANFNSWCTENRKLANHLRTSSRMRSRPRSDNPMTGRLGGDHHNAKAVIVENIYYPSLSTAVTKTRYTKSMLEKRLKKGIKGFSYA